MILIVGLGNPGKKYEKTRHNIGARVVGELEHLNLKGAVLAKPTTFMNDSGKAILKITKNYKLKTKYLFIVHDDLDLPLGKLKISFGRGSAGHKGVQSIINELGTKDFVRFRVGIKPATSDKRPARTTEIVQSGGQATRAEKFVLQNFTKDEEKIVKKAIKKTAEAVDFCLKEGLEKAMSEVN